MNLKQELLVTGGIGSIALGTFFIAFAASDWQYGVLPPSWLEIFPTGAYNMGGLDLFYIVLGLALWGLGIDALLAARRMSKKSKIVPLPPNLVTVAAGYAAVVVSISTVRFLDLFDLGFFILILVAVFSFSYSYGIWKK